jgi:hypothetical protein
VIASVILIVIVIVIVIGTAIVIAMLILCRRMLSAQSDHTIEFGNTTC